MKLFNLGFIVLISGISFGCVKKEVIKDPLDFVFISPRSGETLESLAQDFLGDPLQAWQIEEFNSTRKVIPGKELVIPLKPFRPGGLTAAGHQLIPVLSYHNFSKGPSNKKLTVSASDFEAQLRYLKNNNYHALTLNQLLSYLEFGQVPKQSVFITIDDGWTSSYNIAYPLLKKYGFNATMFIPTNFLESRNRKKLNWDQVQEMVNNLTISIQCHSKSHRDLNTMIYGKSLKSYISSVEKEVISSKNIIIDNLGTTVTSIAYPYGNTNPVVIEILKRNGYKAAFTVKRKSNPFFVQNFYLNRSMVYGTYKLGRFIENLKIIQDSNIDKIEPIDTMRSIYEITYKNPGSYEEKAQWRTALLAWKLNRDWLISYQDDATIKKQLSRKGDISKLIKVAESKISELDAKTKNIAASYFNEAMQKDVNQNVEQLLLRTLLYNPNHQLALEKLKNNLNKQQLQNYWVNRNDTFKIIARQLYKDKGKSVLIPLFNPSVKSNVDLKPGMKLILPTASGINKIKMDATNKCRVVLTKPAIKLAEDYYVQANDLFARDEISKAIAKLNSAVCLNPKHQQAKEMLDMLTNLD